MNISEEMRKAVLSEAEIHKCTDKDNLFQSAYNRGYQDAIQRVLNDLDIIVKSHERK